MELIELELVSFSLKINATIYSVERETQATQHYHNSAAA